MVKHLDKGLDPTEEKTLLQNIHFRNVLKI